MKTKLTNGMSLPACNGCENRISFSGIVKSIFVLFLLFICFNYAHAQNTPASNIRGPLKAKANGANLTITSEVQTDVASPNVSYSLMNNSSGASIVSQGPIQYNASTGVATQTIVVNPGTAKGGFNIKLTVTTPGGTAESSKSVTVQQ